MYTFDDLLHAGAGRDNHETVIQGDQVISLVSGSELANAGQMADLQAMFPDTTLNASPNVVYFPYRLCHSLPSVNSRRRAFTPRVLANSFATALDQLIDLDHELEDNGLGDGDKILGFTKAISFKMPSLASTRELSHCPDIALPVMGLGMLWTRAKAVQSIVHEHASRKNWKVSMECSHDWNNAYLQYRGEYIPIREADGGMLECIQQDGCRPFQGHEMAVLLGGLEGKVDFWGAALTTTPADKDAKVLQFVSGYNRSVANMGRKVFMPMHYLESQREVASEISHKRVIELASIQPIGETDPTEDGHTHLIMGDMTIMPSNGHDHYLVSKAITRGTNPELTGVTDSHSMYTRDSSGAENRTSHAHSIKVPLKGKFTKAGKQDDTTPTDVALANQTHSEIAEMKRTLAEALAELQRVTTSLANEKDAVKLAGFQLEIAKISKEIGEHNAEQATGELVTKAIEKMVADGKLVSKEKADEMVAEKVKEQEEAAKEAQRIAGLKALRTEKLKSIGVALDMPYGDLKDANGNPVTVQSRLDSIGYDDAGESQFNMESQLLSSLVQVAKQIAPVEGVAKVEETLHAEAANASKSGKGGFDVKKILAAVGGGSTVKGGEETAGAGGGAGGAEDDKLKFGNKPKVVNKQNIGIYAFSKL